METARDAANTTAKHITRAVPPTAVAPFPAVPVEEGRAVGDPEVPVGVAVTGTVGVNVCHGGGWGKARGFRFAALHSAVMDGLTPPFNSAMYVALLGHCK
jgi:hypothetical protein